MQQEQGLMANTAVGSHGSTVSAGLVFGDHSSRTVPPKSAKVKAFLGNRVKGIDR